MGFKNETVKRLTALARHFCEDNPDQAQSTARAYQEKIEHEFDGVLQDCSV